MLLKSAIVFMSSTLALLAGNGPIGMATAVGSIRVDNAEVRGNATVLDGTSVETNENPSQIFLKSGNRFELAPDSAGTIYSNRLLLEKGSAQLHASSDYSVVANTLQIVPKGASTLRVDHEQGNTVQVSVVGGQAEVLNRNGLLVAMLMPGSALNLAPESGNGSGMSTVTGVVKSEDGHYFLSDDTTHVTFELKGENLAPAVGKQVTVTGTADTANVASGASEALHVVSYAVIEGQAAGAGAGAGAATGAAAGAAAHTALITTVVVAGVAAAAGGLAAGGVFSGGKSHTVSPQ